MACEQLQGIIKDCTNNLGGVQRIWLIRAKDVVTVYTAFDTGLITQIDVLGNGFVEYQVPNNTAQYTVNYSVDNEGVQEYVHQLNLTINRRLKSKHHELQNLAAGNQDLVAIILDANNEYWLLGWRHGMNLTTLDGGSGTQKSDGSNYNLVLSGAQETLERGISAANISTVIPGEIVG